MKKEAEIRSMNQTEAAADTARVNAADESASKPTGAATAQSADAAQTDRSAEAAIDSAKSDAAAQPHESSDMVRQQQKKTVETAKRRKPIYELNAVRAFCAFAIVAHHFSAHSDCTTFKPLYLMANGSWGTAVVGAFFMLSGGLLYYNDSDLFDEKGRTAKRIGGYYRKRWLAIFPLFYLVYAFYAFRSVITAHSGLYNGGTILSYLPTVLGVDGYLSSGTDGTLGTYYIVGEWFLGAIILLYIIYPLVLRVFTASPLAAVVISAALYVFSMYFPLTSPSHTSRTLSSCLFSFVLGMAAIKWRTVFFNRWCALAFLAVCTVLQVVPLPLSDRLVNVGMHVFSCGILSIGFQVGALLMKAPPLFTFTNFLSRISYAVFLVQHQVILLVLVLWDPLSGRYALLAFLVICVATVFMADMFTAFGKVVTGRFSRRDVGAGHVVVRQDEAPAS